MLCLSFPCGCCFALLCVVCAENLLFWSSVEHYRSRDASVANAVSIYRMFVGLNSPLQVNLSSEASDQITTLLQPYLNPTAAPSASASSVPSPQPQPSSSSSASALPLRHPAPLPSIRRQPTARTPRLVAAPPLAPGADQPAMELISLDLGPASVMVRWEQLFDAAQHEVFVMMECHSLVRFKTTSAARSLAML
jgi:hypothetical protein